MAKYRVIKKSFIDGKIYDPELAKSPDDMIVEYDGPVSDNLEPVGHEGKHKKLTAAEAQARLKAAAETENPNNAKVPAAEPLSGTLHKPR